MGDTSTLQSVNLFSAHDEAITASRCPAVLAAFRHYLLTNALACFVDYVVLTPSGFACLGVASRCEVASYIGPVDSSTGNSTAAVDW